MPEFLFSSAMRIQVQGEKDIISEGVQLGLIFADFKYQSYKNSSSYAQLVKILEFKFEVRSQNLTSYIIWGHENLADFSFQLICVTSRFIVECAFLRSYNIFGIDVWIKSTDRSSIVRKFS